MQYVQYNAQSPNLRESLVISVYYKSTIGVKGKKNKVNACKDSKLKK